MSVKMTGRRKGQTSGGRKGVSNSGRCDANTYNRGIDYGR